MVLARENPFASVYLDALTYRPQGTAWQAIVNRLNSQHRRGLIVGAEGTGKSTLLRRLFQCCRENIEPAELWRIAFRQQRLTPQQLERLRRMPADTTLFVDSLEQLNAWGWWSLKRLSRNLRGLVATSHRPGRLPTLVATYGSIELLKELVAELFPDGAERLQPRLDQLFDSYGGNVRECLRELYEWLACE